MMRVRDGGDVELGLVFLIVWAALAATGLAILAITKIAEVLGPYPFAAMFGIAISKHQVQCEARSSEQGPPIARAR